MIVPRPSVFVVVVGRRQGSEETSRLEEVSDGREHASLLPKSILADISIVVIVSI